MNILKGGQSALLNRITDKWVARLVAGFLFLAVISGCSVSATEARATYQAEVIKVTATAQADLQILANTTPVSPNALATVTVVVAQNNYARKQAEDQMFTGIGIGLFIIIVVVVMALTAGWYYGGYVYLKTQLEIRRQNLRRNRLC